MSFAITEWNLNPNRNWYVKLADAGSDISVKLYSTQADAAAGSNLVAEGTADFGTGSECILEVGSTANFIISLFNDALLYHLKVTGADADTVKTFHVAPFIDLPGINHNIYRASEIIRKKAVFEINKHTHTHINRSIGIANHNTGLRTDDVINIQSSMRSLNVMAIVKEILITATTDSLIDQIETVEYTDVSYE